MPNTQPIQPIHETIEGALRNALQIALAAHENLAGDAISPTELSLVLHDVTRLVRYALVELSEPTFAAMQAGEILLKEWSGTPEPERQLRDTIQGILTAQLSGVVPKTWSTE